MEELFRAAWLVMATEKMVALSHDGARCSQQGNREGARYLAERRSALAEEIGRVLCREGLSMVAVAEVSHA